MDHTSVVNISIFNNFVKLNNRTRYAGFLSIKLENSDLDWAFRNTNRAEIRHAETECKLRFRISRGMTAGLHEVSWFTGPIRV